MTEQRATSETTSLDEMRTALVVASDRTAGLVDSLPDATAPIADSTWTVREAAVHLAMVGFRYAGMVHGEPNQYPSLAPEECARRDDQLIADIPESGPTKLAALIQEATGHLLTATANCRDTRSVRFHGGKVITVPQLVGTALAEHLLRGYDMALAAWRPWPIDRRHAELALVGYRSSYGLDLPVPSAKWTPPADPVGILLAGSGRIRPSSNTHT